MFLSRVFLFPLHSFADHISLTPDDCYPAPDRTPYERHGPAYSIRNSCWNFMYECNDGEGGSQQKRWHGPEYGLLEQHLLEAGASIITGRKSFSVRPAGTGIDGNDIFNEIIHSRQNLFEKKRVSIRCRLLKRHRTGSLQLYLFALCSGTEAERGAPVHIVEQSD